MARDIHGRRRTGARAAGSGGAAAAGPRTGAVAVGGEDHRRRGLGWLWLLLLAAVVAALILWLALRHHGNTPVGAAANHSASPAAVMAPVSPTAAPTTMTSASAQPSTSTGALVTTSTPASVSSPPASSAPAVSTAPGSAPSATTAEPGTGAAAGDAGTVLFAAGSTVVDPRGRTALDAAAARLRATHARAVTVTGFADDRTGPAANTALAEARVAAVAEALRTDLVGTTTTVSTRVAGQTDPAVAETTAAGRLADARVTVTTAGAALIGGDGVPVHPAAGSAALPAAGAGTSSSSSAPAPAVVGVALFPSGSAVLDPADRAVAAAAAAQIAARRSTADHSSVVVTGYTDSVGGAAGALALSRARAQAVADALGADLGAAAPAITVRAVGAQQQIASDATADGRRLNRRTVISLD